MKKTSAIWASIALTASLAISATPAQANPDRVSQQSAAASQEVPYEQISPEEQARALADIEKQFPAMTEADIQRLNSGQYTTSFTGTSTTAAPSVQAQSMIFWCPSSGSNQTSLATYNRTAKSSMSSGSNTLRCGAADTASTVGWGFRHIKGRHEAKFEALDTNMSCDLTMDKHISRVLAHTGASSTYKSSNQTYTITVKSFIKYQSRNVAEYYAYVVVAAASGNVITSYPGDVSWY